MPKVRNLSSGVTFDLTEEQLKNVKDTPLGDAIEELSKEELEELNKADKKAAKVNQ